MAETKTQTSVADELKTAAKRLRCDCSFPVEPPYTLWSPGPCVECGAAFPDFEDEIVPEALREPLVKLLESAAWVAKEHPQDPDYAGLPGTRFCTACQDEETTCVSFVGDALAVARALNRPVS